VGAGGGGGPRRLEAWPGGWEKGRGGGGRGRADAKARAAGGPRRLEDSPAGLENGKAQAASGRDANGRFVKGNPGGPGNPFARKVATLRRALIDFVTGDDREHVAVILKEKVMSE